MIWTIVGSTAAALTTFSFIPQIIKIVKKKSASDVSLITILQLSLGTSLWVAYGVYRKDLIIVLANSITFLSLAILLYFYHKFNYYEKN